MLLGRAPLCHPVPPQSRPSLAFAHMPCGVDRGPKLKSKHALVIEPALPDCLCVTAQAGLYALLTTQSYSVQRCGCTFHLAPCTTYTLHHLHHSPRTLRHLHLAPLTPCTTHLCTTHHAPLNLAPLAPCTTHLCTTHLCTTHHLHLAPRTTCTLHHEPLHLAPLAPCTLTALVPCTTCTTHHAPLHLAPLAPRTTHLCTLHHAPRTLTALAPCTTCTTHLCTLHHAPRTLTALAPCTTHLASMRPWHCCAGRAAGLCEGWGRPHEVWRPCLRLQAVSQASAHACGAHRDMQIRRCLRLCQPHVLSSLLSSVACQMPSTTC